jgi:GR25 family glycosyltransferase involved in LPS biosynthesis
MAAWREEGYIPEQRLLQSQMKHFPAKISCLMSHVRVWEQLAEETDPDAFYLIIEDDAYPAPGFEARYKGVLNELRGVAWDWMFLAIHPNFAKYNHIAVDGKNLINHAPPMVGNAGYLLSRRGALKLMRCVALMLTGIA